MKLSKIAEILHQKINKIPDIEINNLLTDSRSLSFPKNTLFFALTTSRNDGHKYISELYRQNVRYFVVSETNEEFNKLPDAHFFKVENVLDVLQQISAVHRSQFDIPVIGITGSNGKTVVKEWLYQLLNSDFRIVRSPRSYNSQIGVPISAWSLSETTQLGIFEAGISEINEMAKLQKVIQPTIGIFTNLGDAHQEGFTSLKQKCEEKLKLFTDANTLIYCSDNKLVDITIQQSALKAKLFSWGKNGNSLKIIDTEKLKSSTNVQLKYQNSEFPVTIPFSDDASVENALQCVAVMLYLGQDVVAIQQRIAKLEPVAMRLEVKEGLRNTLIINDTYNSDLNSLEIALSFLNRQAESKKLPKTVILSDIFQSGYTSEELYQTVSNQINIHNIDTFIAVGSEISQHQDKFNSTKKYFFKDTEELLKSSILNDLQSEVILLKGSRIFHFEDVLAKLELIAHETTLDVNLNALVKNLNYFRSKLKSETKIMCMVKAFAYGSGAIEVARTLQQQRVDYLAVAVADEGAELRREGIRSSIIVMNPEKGAFSTIFDYRLEPEIYSFRLLKMFIESAGKQGLTDYPIHVKIDTGMHRLGFDEKDLTQLIEILKNQNQVKVRSVFSHLVGADSSEFDDFTKEQIATYTRCADVISSQFKHQIIRHILNSAGIERFSESQFDMVRLGIGHYGISALPDVKLETVCTLKTVILQIRDVKAGDTVGYSRKGKITKDSRIGVIPVGYADGFDRHLGNGNGEVWINGHRAKTVGNVCMDLVMVDLTDIPASEGDLVEIFGDNITLDELAEKLQTISYEILTSVSRRVNRIYYVD